MYFQENGNNSLKDQMRQDDNVSSLPTNKNFQETDQMMMTRRSKEG